MTCRQDAPQGARRFPLKDITVKKIGTHDGPFHADEVFAVAALRRLYPDAYVIRSRDPEALAALALKD